MKRAPWALVVLVGCAPPPSTRPSPTPTPRPSPTPSLSGQATQPQVTISDAKGRPLFSLRGMRGTLPQDSHTALLTGTAATLYKDGTPTLTVTAPDVRFDPKARIMTAEGGVTAQTQGSAAPRRLYTDRLTWAPDQDTVQGDGHVRIELGPDAQIIARHFTANTRLQRLRLLPDF